MALPCPLTEHEEVEERGLAGRVVPEADAADVGAIVLHGDSTDGDADVPAVGIAAEMDAVLVALPVLQEPVKVARHSIALAQREGQHQSRFPLGESASSLEESAHS